MVNYINLITIVLLIWYTECSHMINTTTHTFNYGTNRNLKIILKSKIMILTIIYNQYFNNGGGHNHYSLVKENTDL